MSVAITELDMPKCCIDCPIYNHEFGMCNCIPNSYCYNKGPGLNFEKVYDPFKEKHSNCPLREIDYD